MAKSLLFKTKYPINNHITIRIPTVKEIIDNEDDYYGNIALIVSTPYDMMVQLDDIGIDFTTLSDWDLFCLMFKELQTNDTSLIFGDLQLQDFDFAVNQQNGNIVLFNEKTGVVIDKAIHEQICVFLRKLLRIEKNDKRPANEEAKKFMIERARRRQKRKKKEKDTSQLEDIIIALVNTTEFPYDYESVKKITIYQLNASLQQVVRKVNYDKLMIGCYAGTVNMKEIDQHELNWISN